MQMNDTAAQQRHMYEVVFVAEWGEVLHRSPEFQFYRDAEAYMWAQNVRYAYIWKIKKDGIIEADGYVVQPDAQRVRSWTY
jgi:hypothetical protein